MGLFEYDFDFIYIIYFMVIIGGFQFIVNMIKDLGMGFFGFYFMGVCNNKIKEKYFIFF